MSDEQGDGGDVKKYSEGAEDGEKNTKIEPFACHTPCSAGAEQLKLVDGGVVEHLFAYYGWSFVSFC